MVSTFSTKIASWRCSVGDQPFSCRSPRSIGETVGNGHTTMFTELQLEGGLYSSWICPGLICKTIVDVALFVENLKPTRYHPSNICEGNSYVGGNNYLSIDISLGGAQTYLSFHAEHGPLKSTEMNP
ncbi:hypothetical protein AVEN_142648-1 [Araneus ventricosus]|uniref:Uncharacterized protein n=1 Tax=Araneus ventricosus TaxID=182803 RepID=A0A4Y2UCU4_ARAVE|nr:hypothetical protein AVEN_142648-1 [Araneus ventricosus]